MKRSKTFVEEFTKILMKQRVVKPDEALAMKKAFFDRSQEAFDNFLVEEGIVSRTDILNALSVYYSVPSFDCVGYFFDHHLLRQFPEDFLLRNEIIPQSREENILFVVASHPNDPELLPKIGKHVSYDIQFLVGITGDITDAVEEFYDKALTEVPGVDFVENEEENKRKAQMTNMFEEEEE